MESFITFKINYFPHELIATIGIRGHAVPLPFDFDLQDLAKALHGMADWIAYEGRKNVR